MTLVAIANLAEKKIYNEINAMMGVEDPAPAPGIRPPRELSSLNVFQVDQSYVIGVPMDHLPQLP